MIKSIIIKRIKSFKHAFRGIFHATYNEVNFRIQISIITIIILGGIFYKINLFEWLSIVVVSGMLLSAELLNTTIEEFIDHLIKDHHEGARVIKDLAAGYVLVTAFCALVVYLLIFVPRIFQNLS